MRRPLLFIFNKPRSNRNQRSTFETMAKRSLVALAILALVVIVVMIHYHASLPENRIRGVDEAYPLKERGLKKKKKVTKLKMKPEIKIAAKWKGKGKGKGTIKSKTKANKSKGSFFSKKSKMSKLPNPKMATTTTATPSLATQSPSQKETGPCLPGDVSCVVLFSEDYENPLYDFSNPSLNTVFSCCCFDNEPEGEPNALVHWNIDLENTVNLAYGRGSNLYDQDFTVEVIYLQTYKDQASGQSLKVSDGRGGKYAIGMASNVEEDRLRLTFDTQGRKFVNFAMDVAPFEGINSLSCNDGSLVFPTNPAKLKLSAMIESSNTLLSTVTVMGSSGQPNIFSVLWERVCGSLDVSKAVDGNVIFEWDALEPLYIFFDNVDIVASDDPNIRPPGC
jgi:hypothetical protein